MAVVPADPLLLSNAVPLLLRLRLDGMVQTPPSRFHTTTTPSHHHHLHTTTTPNTPPPHQDCACRPRAAADRHSDSDLHAFQHWRCIPCDGYEEAWKQRNLA